MIWSLQLFIIGLAFFLQVIATKCNSLFSIDYENVRNDALVFTNNMTLMNNGNFQRHSKRNLLVHDAKLQSVEQNHPCSLKFPVAREFGSLYRLDLDTGYREPLTQ